jgi:dihydroorotate dehydrogenase (fumarate)
VKLAPYFDTPYFEQATTIISKYDIKFVVSINTIGNALFVDADNECVSMMAKDGFGGLGGGYAKQTALANVRQLSQFFEKKGRSDIDIIGAGGVASGKDAFELILCGAKAVQVGTCHWTEGSGCFARIAGELADIMQKKGYDSIFFFKAIYETSQ